VPIPVKEGVEEPAAKINVLLQAYVSQLKLEGKLTDAQSIILALTILISRLCSRCGHGIRPTIGGTVRPTLFWFPLFYILTPVVSILRAIYEICLKRGWAVPTRAALDMCKMVEKRMYVYSIGAYFRRIYHVYRWSSMTALRQFKGVPSEIIRKAEGKQFVSFWSTSVGTWR
jgi:pre-mRNA-splicing helicase BRR2